MFPTLPKGTFISVFPNLEECSFSSVHGISTDEHVGTQCTAQL